MGNIQTKKSNSDYQHISQPKTDYESFMKLCEETVSDLDKITFSDYTPDMIQQYYKQYEKEDYYFKRC